MASTGEPETPEVIPSLLCAECGVESPRDARGWRVYLDVDDDLHAYCPSCAEREFGAAQ